MELFTLGLTKMREELGADHPFVRKVLGKESPRQVATRVVKGTKLYDVAQCAGALVRASRRPSPPRRIR